MASFNLSLEPAQIEIIIRPNTIFTQAYNITNNSTETLLLSSSISAWLPSDNQGSVTYLDNFDSPLLFSLSNTDLKLGQDFLLKPNQKKQLVLKIINPSPDQSDYYFTFFVSQKPLNTTLSNHQNLAKIGSHILITATDKNSLTSNLEVSKLNITPFLKDVFFPLKIKGEILNNGQNYTSIDGKITILKNDQIYSELNLFPYTVIPNHSRLIDCLDSKDEATPCHLKIPLWPGKYQGLVTLKGNATKYEYSFNFFIFPYTITIFILFLFLTLCLLLTKKPKKQSNH